MYMTAIMMMMMRNHADDDNDDDVDDDVVVHVSLYVRFPFGGSNIPKDVRSKCSEDYARPHRTKANSAQLQEVHNIILDEEVHTMILIRLVI